MTKTSPSFDLDAIIAGTASQDTLNRFITAHGNDDPDRMSVDMSRALDAAEANRLPIAA